MPHWHIVQNLILKKRYETLAMATKSRVCAWEIYVKIIENRTKSKFFFIHRICRSLEWFLEVSGRRKSSIFVPFFRFFQYKFRSAFWEAELCKLVDLQGGGSAIWTTNNRVGRPLLRAYIIYIISYYYIILEYFKLWPNLHAWGPRASADFPPCNVSFLFQMESL